MNSGIFMFTGHAAVQGGFLQLRQRVASLAASSAERPCATSLKFVALSSGACLLPRWRGSWGLGMYFFAVVVGSIVFFSFVPYTIRKGAVIVKQTAQYPFASGFRAQKNAAAF
jgi:hypothetical protein